MMTARIAALARELGAPEGQQGLLELFCQLARKELESQLKPGMTPEDCGEAFPAACALLALSQLEQGGDGISSFTAGEVTIHRSGSRAALRRQAMDLLAPYLKEKEFAFRGVRG